MDNKEIVHLTELFKSNESLPNDFASSAEEEKITLLKKISELEKKNFQLKSENTLNEKSRKDLEHTETIINGLREEVQNIQTEAIQYINLNQTLQEQISKYRQKIEEILIKYEALQENLQTSEMENSNLTQNLTNEKKLVETLNIKISEKEQLSTQLNKEINNLSEKIKAQQIQIKKMLADHDIFRKNNSQIVESKEVKISTLNENLNTLKVKLKNTEEQKTQAVSMYKEMFEIKNQLIQNLSEAEKLIGEKESIINILTANLEEKNTTLLQMHEEIDKKEKCFFDLEKMLSAKNSDLNRMTDVLKITQQELANQKQLFGVQSAEFKTKKAQNDQLTKDLHNQIALLNMNLEEARSQMLLAQSNHETEIQELNRRNENLKQDYADNLALKEKEIRLLEEQILLMKKASETALQENQENLNAIFAEQQNELNKLRHEENKKISELRTTGELKIEQLQTHLKAEMAKLNSQHIAEIDMLTAGFSKEITEFKNAVAQKSQENSSLEKLLSEARLNLQTMTQEKESVSAKNESLTKQTSLYVGFIENEKKAIKQTLNQLVYEIKKASALHPLKDYLAATETELEKYELQLKKIPSSAPARRILEERVEQLYKQKTNLAGLIKNSEMYLEKLKTEILKVDKKSLVLNLPYPNL